MIGLPSLASLDGSSSTRIWLASEPADVRCRYFSRVCYDQPNLAAKSRNTLILGKIMEVISVHSAVRAFQSRAFDGWDVLVVGHPAQLRFPLDPLAKGHVLFCVSEADGQGRFLHRRGLPAPHHRNLVDAGGFLRIGGTATPDVDLVLLELAIVLLR